MATPTAPAPILATTLPTGKKPRQVFVAYSYKLYSTPDYRAVYARVGKALGVEFVFADEKITNLHILQKIANFIRESQFAVYDISGWNPNVTLEFGLSLGYGEKAYIAIDPTKTPVEDVPADLRGLDRLQYNSFSELEAGLARLIGQEFPPEKKADPIAELREQVLQMLEQTPGLSRSDVATALGISPELASLVLGQMVGTELDAKGEKRGRRYYPREKGP